MKRRSSAPPGASKYNFNSLKTAIPENLSLAILQTSSSIILGLDKDAKIVLFNRGAEETTGWKASEVIGKNWMTLFIPKSERKIISEVFKDTVKKKIGTAVYENAILKKNGKKIIIRWHNTIIQAKGKFVMTLSVGDDLTDLRETEKKLKKKKPGAKRIIKNEREVLSRHYS